MFFFTWLSSFTLAPVLAIAGALAVLSPIIIHLLNKRKFKIVDWAAMDFLLDADKRNRRRVRLENIILLALRCLAVFLLGLLLAQPFIPNEYASNLLGGAQFEHIFVLDDSLSTQVQTGNQSPFEDSKQKLMRLLQQWSNDRNEDTFTLILTSAPDQRQINGARVTKDSVAELVETVKALEPTDRSADLPGLLTSLESELKSMSKNVTRLLYVVNDLRRRDWVREGAEAKNDPAKTLERMAQDLTYVYIVDIGGTEDKNLAVVEVRPEGTLVAGVVSRFDVTVANYGSTEARDLVVKFTAGDALPIEQTIERILPGQTASVPFSFTFSGAETEAESEDEDLAGQLPLAPVRVNVDVTSSNPGDEDRLLADSTAFFPARVVRGIPALIVDGDPSADEEKSESAYLRRALEPTGEYLSGVAVDVVHESEMETMSLSKYDVIFLCNVYQFSEKVRKELEGWVERGGGLVILPGDQVDERIYNDLFYKEGKGLSPVKLEGIEGDETETKWANFKLENSQHRVLGVFEGTNNPALSFTKIFRWWKVSAAKEQLGKIVEVPARFNDPDQSIAMAEKMFGQGRVFFLAIPADADWTNWPQDPVAPAYIYAMQDLVRYLLGDESDHGSLRVGELLTHTIDISDYKTDAELKLPKEKKVSLQAREPDAKNGAKADSAPAAPGEEVSVPPGDDGELSVSQNDVVAEAADPAAAAAKQSPAKAASTRWRIDYDDIGRRGFYELLVSRNNGIDEQVLFAANADPTEGDLTRVEEEALRESFGEAENIKIIKASAFGNLFTAGAQRELWKYLLLIAVVVLCGEQLLAWSFGLKR